MAIPQTTYPADLAIGLEGQLSDSGHDAHVRSAVNATQAMEFGRAAMQGTNPEDVTLPTGTAADFAGVTMFSHVGSGDTTSTGIPATTPVNLLRKGRIKVIPETVVDVGDPVYYRFQNAGADPEAIGRFRNDDDAASGDVVRLDDTLPVRWASKTTAAGQVAVLELNLP